MNVEKNNSITLSQRIKELEIINNDEDKEKSNFNKISEEKGLISELIRVLKFLYYFII